jgi:hypothetical protein
MQQHAETLCAEHDIAWWTNMPGGVARAFPEIEEINTPPIRGAVSYATVLHEIGHMLGRYQQSRRVMVRESWAWRWARKNALIWTPAMERSACSAMAWYKPRAAKIDRERASWPTIAEQLADLLDEQGAE